MELGVWVAPSAVPPSTPLMGIIVKSALHRQGPALCHGADTALWGTNPTVGITGIFQSHCAAISERPAVTLNPFYMVTICNNRSRE